MEGINEIFKDNSHVYRRIELVFVHMHNRVKFFFIKVIEQFFGNFSKSCSFEDYYLVMAFNETNLLFSISYGF